MGVIRVITEYGRVVQSRAYTMMLPADARKWIRTLMFNAIGLDGNPNHALNGGILGMANSHCVGSLINHSNRHAKCVMWPRDLNSPYHLTPDNTHIMGCLFVRAARRILLHEHLLIDYEPQTAATIQNMLCFV